MSFADRIDNAILASQRITGALLAAKAARDAASPLARAGVSDALVHGAAFAAEIKQAADLVKDAQPANDRDGGSDAA